MLRSCVVGGDGVHRSESSCCSAAGVATGDDTTPNGDTFVTAGDGGSLGACAETNGQPPQPVPRPDRVEGGKVCQTIFDARAVSIVHVQLHNRCFKHFFVVLPSIKRAVGVGMAR